jgi:uncharacterized membrane protein
VALAAVGWAATLPAAAQAAAAREYSSLQAFAVAVYGFGSAICHQRVERSFHLAGEALPVCARCTGIYLGGALAAAVFVLTRNARRGGASLAGRSAAWLLLLAALPGVLSLAYEWTSGHVPSNSIRAATGVVLGVGVGWLILQGIEDRREVGE